MAAVEQDQVRKRRVFYIPGYDPIHPRRYRELYRKQSAAQAAITGYQIALSGQPAKGGPFGWRVEAAMDGVETTTDFEVLVWSDIVRATMEQDIPATYMQLLRTAAIYIGTGTLFQLMRLRPGPIIAALYPIVMLLAQLSLAAFCGWGLGALAALFLPAWVGVLAGGVLVWQILEAFRRHDARFFAYYLMHDYAYTAKARGANPPELEARMAEFRETIAEALHDDVDEVLVVGHSSGAHLAVSILADLIRAGLPADSPALGLLTLGQVVPMVSFLPRADRLRADLHYLSVSDRLTWVDVTAPGDGGSFALCDPVAVTGVAPPGKRWPLVLSAAFSQSLTPEHWKALRWRFFRLHFQYLCAFDHPEGYDYFRTTAGPERLGQLYGARQPSKSRIETPVSRYRSMSA